MPFQVYTVRRIKAGLMDYPLRSEVLLNLVTQALQEYLCYVHLQGVKCGSA